MFHEKEIDDRAITQLFSSFEPGHLISNDLMHLNYPITLNELWNAIVRSNRDSVPGQDGIGTFFYKQAFNFIKDDFLKISNSMLTDEIPNFMTYTVFVLLKDKAKKGDINGYRPISLLNSDIRILHQILNIRLQSVLKGIVSEHQTAFIPGRSISTNIHLS